MKTQWTVKKLRDFEASLARDFEKGKINCPIHLSGGNEQQLIDIFKGIKKEDYVISTHRNHYHYLLSGGSEKRLRQAILGKNAMRSMNFCDPSRRFITSAIVAGGCAIACGIGLALQKKKSKAWVWCFVGDGATDSGHFMEAIRFAFARTLPVVFVVEDNDASVDSTKSDRWKGWIGFGLGNVVKYSYKRIYPHVGVGKWVTF